MRRVFNHRLLLPAAALLALALTFASCKKDNVDNDYRTPAAGLMAFNLIPDKTVGFTISGNNLTNFPLAYGNYTGTYVPIIPGSRELRSYDGASNTILATTMGNFSDSGFYSTFAIGYNGSYRNVIVKDQVDTITTSNQAVVRYVNAITDSTASPVVTITSGGTTIVNSNAAYGSVSDFAKVNSGDIIVSVNGGTGISATRTINVTANKIYTILLSGTPGSSDPALAVQIKYISNGTVE